MSDIAAQYRLEQWQEAVKEAMDDLDNAADWRAEKSCRWHLINLVAWGHEQGFALPPQD